MTHAAAGAAGGLGLGVVAGGLGGGLAAVAGAVVGGDPLQPAGADSEAGAVIREMLRIEVGGSECSL